jgi:ABC-type multidrug transport system permease subunit
MYGILPYYLSKIFIDLPILIVTVIVFVIIIYFGIGLVNNAWSFFKFLFTVILVGFLSQLYGLTLSVFFNQPEAAVGIAPIFMLPLMILGGFMTNSGTVPAWFGWLQYISPVRYGFEALQQNEFSGRPNLEFNILGFLSFSLGYGLCMIFMLILCTILMFISVIVLKLKVTRYQ